ncbi:iron-hydroxamate ABC transporter substrate-binding protein [Paenibacillus herberti]|uniref:ABC transporter substrate-binding protein n=1 Tax=Paenibacillus herberti TaxID=1619309 RepID=A0A229NWS7_9BACL|nr:iron-hydroxamate ABC transporter substrate-binding protein [Paenibacillus herberti]OXM14372.1 ABC transporter substrate-binding protein [Paenibacillus herberti]
MKKWLTPLVLSLTLVLSACGSKGDSSTNNASNNGSQPTASVAPSASPAASGTFTYESETGKVEVPLNPQRIVALTNAPNVLSLGLPLVGVDQWSNKSSMFTEKLSGVAEVTDENLEKIIELDPDLIIAGTNMKNLDKMREIAPTVVYTWGKLDYIEQQLAIGKLLNKEKEAQTWADDFKKRAEEAGKQVKAKIGENATVSVIEFDAKSFYVFGNNWARGTEVLYQAMGLGMTENAKKDALGPGMFTISSESLPEYAGDYIVLSRPKGLDNPVFQTETWKGIPAVKSGRVITIDPASYSYSDPITLDHMLKLYTDEFLALP